MYSYRVLSGVDFLSPKSEHMIRITMARLFEHFLSIDSETDYTYAPSSDCNNQDFNLEAISTSPSLALN